VRALLIRLVLSLALVLSASSLVPLAAASEDPGTGPTAEGTATAAPSRSETTSARAQRAPKVTTTITSQPRKVTIYRSGTFRFSSNVAGVEFRCRLRGPNRWNSRFQDCPSTGARTGKRTFRNLATSRRGYRFVVYARIPEKGSTPAVNGTPARHFWRVFQAWSPRHYLPKFGPTFNRPLSVTRTRTNLKKMIRTIDSIPGYKYGGGLCPWAPSLRPGTIRVALYSMTDQRFAKALVAANRRCISVQILMNNHLDRNTDPAWRRLADALGTRRYNRGDVRRSFAYRCSSGCRGSGVLHTKMYLFNSTLQRQRWNRIRHTVSTGSSNMTFNAASIQYNDLFTVRNKPGLYTTFLSVFNKMRRDRFRRNLIQVTNGRYRSSFWPQDRGGPDPEKVALRSISCRGANGGTGFKGRTVVHVNMHAWFGTRGLALARQVRQLYNQGCYVKVLYGFMSFGVFKILLRGHRTRLTARRTLFSHNGRTAYVYSHMKNILASGHVGSDRSAKVSWTGSNNFTDGGPHFDEVMIRIPSAYVYRLYRRQFNFISKRKSSAVYAIFQEPEGGGRPPRLIPGGPAPASPSTPLSPEMTEGLPADTPTVISPDVVFDENGEPHALD
jgi:phosphatidylserine/phosphatidylglycerophosphate/cardiolipin synthase-like enzyme